MVAQIYPCIWLDDSAKKIADFYAKIFRGKVIQRSAETVLLKIARQKMMICDRRSVAKQPSTISFYVPCKSRKELNRRWNLLKDGGSVKCEEDKNATNSKSGWIEDKYGVSWQLAVVNEIDPRIAVCLMFVNEKFGNAEDAIIFYSTVFTNFSYLFSAEHPESDLLHRGKIMHAQFSLNNQHFTAMDSRRAYKSDFNESFTLVLECRSQKEVDFYRNKLTEGGEDGKNGCVRDKFGISWQIVSSIAEEKLWSPPVAELCSKASKNMKKSNIDQLINA